MAFEITRVNVWAGEVEDRPGALAEKLEVLQRAGANLEFAIVRPSAPLSGIGVLYVAPLIGREQTGAGDEAGLRKAESLDSLRIAGPDRPGLLAGVTRLVAGAGINISGLSSAALGEQCVIYLRFERLADTERAAEVLARTLA
jgi:hypothetical protein